MTITADLAGEMLDGVHRAFEMTVSGGDFYGSGRQPHPDHRGPCWCHTTGRSPSRRRRNSSEPPADPAYSAKTSA